MKLYNPFVPNIVRLQITKQGEKTEYMNLCDCTSLEAKDNLKSIIEPFVSKFPEGKRTTINIREAKGGKNGKSISFNFYGINPKDVAELIINNLK